MTNLLNQPIPAQFGNLFTLNNQNNLGLLTNLQAVQDGYGRSSPLELSLTDVNINTTTGTFSIDGQPLLVSTTYLNLIGQPNPTLSGTGSVTIPFGTTAERPTNPTVAMLRFNTTTGQPEIYNGTTWLTGNFTP